MSNYTDECIKNYNCPDCNEAKLQSDKNARKINEVIDQVNALIQVNNETVNFIKEKSVEISEEVAKIKATEVANKVAETKVNELLDELITEIDNSKVGFDGKIHGTLKDRLDNSGAVTYYELAEPTTEQLTPQQLKSFDTTTHIISDNKLMPVVSSKIPSNVQAVVTNLINENIMLTNEIETISLEIEENNLNNIETNLNQEERLTLIEMGVL